MDYFKKCEKVHYTYILYDKKKSICKIGYSLDPDNRRKILSYGGKFNFKLMSKKKFSDYWAAYDYEYKWINHLKPFLFKGREYFHIKKSIINEIIEDFEIRFFNDYRTH